MCGNKFGHSLCKHVLYLHKNSHFNLGVLVLICSTYKCNLKDIMNYFLLQNYNQNFEYVDNLQA
jgi:hypothetical protein